MEAEKFRLFLAFSFEEKCFSNKQPLNRGLFFGYSKKPNKVLVILDIF